MLHFDSALLLQPGFEQAEEGRRSLEHNVARRVRQFAADGDSPYDVVAETARIFTDAYRGRGDEGSDGGFVTAAGWDWLLAKQGEWHREDTRGVEGAAGTRDEVGDDDEEEGNGKWKWKETGTGGDGHEQGSGDEDEENWASLQREL